MALLIAPANDWLAVLIVGHWIAQEIGKIVQITLSVGFFCDWWEIARGTAKKRLQAKIMRLGCVLTFEPSTL